LEIKFIPEVRAFVIKGLFSEQECSDIMAEQISLLPQYRLAQYTGTAVDKKMLPVKKNRGIFLHQTKNSMAVKHTLKILDTMFVSHLCSYDSFYEKLKNCVIVNTLISYYKDGDYYKSHTDGISGFTVTHYIVKEPLAFSGGELLLYYKDSDVKEIKLSIKNNMTVIFPSETPHRVNKVSLDDQRIGYGRFCITNFVNERQK
jgi:predicted 2-oxoglutarate/Fe(II)-dependent dioxygenase YbiX